MIALVGWGVYSAVTWAVGSLTNRTDPQPTVTETGPSVDELSNPIQCTPDNLAVDFTFPETVTGGARADLAVTFENTGPVPCVTDTGYVASTIQIFSGNDLVWDRAHCGVGTPERKILLNIGATDTFTLAWNGKRSANGCPGEQPDAEPGTYRLEITPATAPAAEKISRVFIVD